MPIYAYRCGACGHAKDALQKLSDAPLTQCPACGAESFSKQVTAAGFQLKGSGWYATDFKGSGAAPAAPAASAPAESSSSSGNSTDSGSGSSSASGTPPAAAPAPATEGSR